MWYNILTTQAKGYQPIAIQPNRCYIKRNPVRGFLLGWYLAIGDLAGFSIWKGIMSQPLPNLIGQKFGKLTVLELSEKKDSRGGGIWVCQCDCGNIKEIKHKNIQTTKSCGCLPTSWKDDPNRIKDLIGKRFRKLTVLRATSERKNHHIVWECLCDCGNTIMVSASHLKNGNVGSCGCLPHQTPIEIIDLTGQRFGKLIVIEMYGRQQFTNSTSIIWTCKCDCGVTKNILGSSLRKGLTKSCGCSFREFNAIKKRARKGSKIMSTKVAVNTLYGQYKRNAEKRDLVFELPIEVFQKLITSPCYYCGIKPSRLLKRARQNSTFFYNGIDRQNNQVGYIISNSVSCCSKCNFRKSTDDFNEFTEWIERVYSNLMEKEII